MSVNLVTASSQSSRNAPESPTMPGLRRRRHEERDPRGEIEQERDVDEA